MASPSGLSLECKPQSYSMLLNSFGDHSHPDQSTQKLEEYLSSLEEERLKIDAFKRELPLCMQLLTNEMEAKRQQLQSYRGINQGPRPVLEEFIPLKHSNSEGLSEQNPANISDKATWMTSAQLSLTSPKSEIDTNFNISPKLALNKQRNGGAFIPFTKDRSSSGPNLAIRALPDLALASSEREMEDNKYSETEKGINGVAGQLPDTQTATANTTTAAAATTTTTTQTHRKARRCWSPDLHRRFVHALQMLGGSQVATPKQIRELMKVDGLTNDEVKSHLQKYRLHTRRPSPSPQTTGAPAPQLVVLGGIWVPPEYAAATHGGAPTIYSATSQVSPHYCSPPVQPQDFYPPPPPLPHSQLHHHHHHQMHIYKSSSQAHQTQSSPESDPQGVGDRSESIEDGKSESSSWKGDSGGENGEDRKSLAALRDDGEESNGSEITLKF